jgi:murein L,D-transpeptidase YafK
MARMGPITSRKAKLVAWLVLAGLSGRAAAGPSSFRVEQDRFPRVRQARIEAQPRLEAMFRDAGLSYPAREIFLRGFKLEGQFELWARNDKNGPFTLIHVYEICASAGVLGPKRREGDLQVPEGFYHVSGFNPRSRFHLSLRIDYPNASDRILGDRRHPGGDIFIHGSCVTIGCIPLRDGPIAEVYLAAVDARSSGQARIPVHIFPRRLGGDRQDLERQAGGRPSLRDFWLNLKEGYDHFEKYLRLPAITVDSRGRYLFH